MTLQSLPLSAILPPESNPRTVIDPARIKGLAASILADGLLQNLVVAPVPDQADCYRLVSGERRYRALHLLVTRGALRGCGRGSNRRIGPGTGRRGGDAKRPFEFSILPLV